MMFDVHISHIARHAPSSQPFVRRKSSHNEQVSRQQTLGL